jgi:multidrug efflux pump subunit AcrB
MVGLLAALGLNAFMSIPRAEDPSFNAPFFSVTVLAPGMEAKEVEQLIAEPVEAAFNELEDVVEIRSTSTAGVLGLVIQFDWGLTNMDRKYDEIIREMNRLRPSLPSAVRDVLVRKGQPGLTNIVQFAIVGNVPYVELHKRAKDLKEAIERVPGVRSAEQWGAPQPEVRVALNLPRMAELGLTPDAVSRALQGENASIPGGSVEAGGRRFNLKTSGAYTSLEEIAATPVASANGMVVALRDIAAISWSQDEETHVTRYNKEKAVFVTANMRDLQNVFQVRDGIAKAAEAYAKTLPSDLRLEFGFDQSKSVDKRLNQLGKDFLIAVSLVLITLLPLGLRAALVVAFSIPLSLAIGVFLLNNIDYSLNQLSIAGFVLALGLLVDDSIVVTENIARHLRMGKTPVQAAIEGTRQITFAVLGCTATLMLAFLPLVFLPEGAGAFTRSLPIAVLLSVGASLFVSLTVIPFLASRILKNEGHPEGNFILRWVMSGVHGLYRPLLHVALMRPLTTVIIAMVLFAGTVALVPRIGFSLFPPADSRQYIVQIELPEGASLAETDKALRFVEDTILARPETESVMSNLGRGNPRIYYNVNQRELAPHYAEAFVNMKQFTPGETPKMYDELRKVFDAYPGARILVKVFENGPPIDAPIMFRVLGSEVSEVHRIASEVEAVMASVPGVRDINNPVRYKRTDLQIRVDPDKAALAGIAPGAADRIVRLAVAGERVTDYRDSEGESYPVVLRLPLDSHHSPDVLGEIYVPSQAGGLVPLSQIAALDFTASAARIDRFDRVRSATITAYAASGYLTSNLSAEIARRLNEIELPPGYSIATGGQAEAAARSFGGMGTAALVALFGIFAVLVLEFRSFKSSLIVASVIPLGIMGGLLGLYVTGYTLSFTAVIGLIALVGIEIKNSILLVDFTDQLRAQGKSLRDAIEEAGEVRFLPILLTSITAIGGLTPLALQGSGLYSPLACVIIGGLITSTLLSRLVVPAFYLLLAPKAAAHDDYVESGPIPSHAKLAPGE